VGINRLTAGSGRGDGLAPVPDLVELPGGSPGPAAATAAAAAAAAGGFVGACGVRGGEALLLAFGADPFNAALPHLPASEEEEEGKRQGRSKLSKSLRQVVSKS